MLKGRIIPMIDIGAFHEVFDQGVEGGGSVLVSFMIVNGVMGLDDSGDEIV